MTDPSHPPSPTVVPLRTATVVRFWAPLAATWLMMSAEGPYVAAIIARMPEAAFNLAAYGVAFSIAWLIESPIMMLLTAANRLVRDRDSFLAVRKFMYELCVALTIAMILCVTPPVYSFLAFTVMHLPADVARLAHIAIAILIPWPAAIGYRRFYQGVLVHHRLTRRVAYGTVVRLASMTVAGAVLAVTTSLHGSSIGAIALATGVLCEAAASRWMARHVVATLLATAPVGEHLTQRAIARFYYPLALTSVIYMITAPLLTFFIGRGRSPVESLAVLPVVQGLLFIFRGGGVAFQEAGVALSGRHHEHEREVGRAGFMLACASSATLAALLFTPLGDGWWRSVSGLTPSLAALAAPAAQLLILLPATEYWLSFQRSRFILNGETRVITIATIIEVGGIAAALPICIGPLALTGVVAGSIAMLFGRLLSNTFLILATSRSQAAILAS